MDLTPARQLLTSLLASCDACRQLPPEQRLPGLLSSLGRLLALDHAELRLPSRDGEPQTSGVGFPLGDAGQHELWVSATRPGFPNEDERLLLRLAACQLALVAAENALAQPEPTHARDRSRRARERLGQLFNLQELIASLAHDVRQPLAAIITNANAVRRWLALEPPNLAEARAAGERIVHEGARANDLLTRVRAKLTPELMQSDALDVHAAFRELVESFAAEAAAANVGMRVLAADVPRVQGDANLLQHVLHALTQNALEAVVEGAQDRPRQVEFSAELSGGEVCIRVRDTGPGLTEREQAFQLLYSTKPHALGLGLSVSRALVRRWGGRMWSAPHPQGGEIFCFTLPVAAV